MLFALSIEDVKIAIGLFTGAAVLVLLSFLLRALPAIVDSPQTHVCQETRLVQIGAADPVTKHHMILQLSLDESDQTEMAKEVREYPLPHQMLCMPMTLHVKLSCLCSFCECFKSTRLILLAICKDL